MVMLIYSGKLGCVVITQKKHKRASGRVYENDEKKMAEIKVKYKNGVTKEIINEWINNL